MKKISLFFIVSISMLLLNCSFNKPTLLNYVGNEDEPIRTKRIMKNMERPTAFHWSRVAFKKNTSTLHFLLSPEQKEIIGEYGQPDYMRTFRSTDKEVICEWLFLDDNKLVQFIHRKVAFEGPITDFENVLIKKGYPQHTSPETFKKDSIVRDTLMYQSTYGLENDIYTFSNGNLIYHNDLK